MLLLFGLLVLSAQTMTTITTLIFDVDDTLYDVGTGFTAHRNGEGATSFMVEKLNFPNHEVAKALRDEYFERYHSTAKALTIAEKEGKFPGPPSDEPRFRAQDLAEWWAERLDFSILKGPKPASFIKDLEECPLNLVAFSNGPRKYVKRALKELGLWENVFKEETLFAVDDVLPYCKPDKEAFQIVFDALGVKKEECVIVEDSMKNIRECRRLGLKTILIKGDQSGKSAEAAALAEATKPGDAPLETDPAVDVCVEVVEDIRAVLPGLWKSPGTFQ